MKTERSEYGGSVIQLDCRIAKSYLRVSRSMIRVQARALFTDDGFMEEVKLGTLGAGATGAGLPVPKRLIDQHLNLRTVPLLLLKMPLLLFVNPLLLHLHLLLH